MAGGNCTLCGSTRRSQHHRCTVPAASAPSHANGLGGVPDKDMAHPFVARCWPLIDHGSGRSRHTLQDKDAAAASGKDKPQQVTERALGEATRGELR